MKKLIKWFDLNIGWFFVNGRKQKQYAKEMQEKYDLVKSKVSSKSKPSYDDVKCRPPYEYYKNTHVEELQWLYNQKKKKARTKNDNELKYAKPPFCKKYKKTETSKQSICEEAHKIVNDRNEEKERMYGPFSEGMDRAAQVYNGMTGLNITGKEMYIALIALKFSRESYNHRRDNLLDAVSYIQGLDNYLNNN